MESQHKTCTHKETPKVRGSPQTRGYVHQSVASCKIIFQKAGYNPGQLCCLHILGLHFKNSSQSIPLSLPLGSMNFFFQKRKLWLIPYKNSYKSRPYLRHTHVDKVRFMFRLIHTPKQHAFSRY